MIDLKILALSCFITLSFAATTKADERFMPYIEWIVENSDMEYNGEPLPTLDIMPYDLLQIEVYGAEQVAQAEYQGYELAPVLGGYDDENKRMMFPDTGDVWEMQDVMVHELYHYMQDINGTMTDCPGDSEVEAYKLHELWMDEHNVEGERPNLLWAVMLQMACQEHYYWDGHPP